ncbi:hypothetical protein MACH17_19170 [Phaeobacter inhibens]|uniref:hypothetical protein n=1 Tax=Phaeobacter inhibens TaxID=221822 RepID=UPI00276A00DA|nr:hypothetical protein [Phaeobacter inhibens]GLO70400.1 hypothetical protein MACH17_19170 [Phaeobacter inhibens]
MTLYTKGGSYPAPLSFRIRLSDGRSRTDPASFTAEGIADAGYIAAPPQPDHDPETQRLTWDGAAWGIEDIPVPDPVYRALTKLEAMTLFRHVTGMDDAGELTMREDPAIKLLWMKWETDVPQSIHRDNPVVEHFLSGLIAAGYADVEHKAAMLDGWPTA